MGKLRVATLSAAKRRVPKPSPVKEEKSEEMSKEQRVNYTQWLKRGTNMFLPTDNSVTQARIDAGVYNIRHSDNVGFYLFKKDLNLDELIELPMPENKKVLSSIKTFWGRKDKFKQYGYAYKRGILLYGVPGGGKTSLINLLCKHLIEEMDGVIFNITDDRDLDLYQTFMPEVYRIIEKDRPIITIIEDIDGLCDSRSTETQLINVLDGISQIEDVVYIATTNYTERLSERIMNRPNRFDRRIEVKSPNDTCRKMYFQHKLKEEDLKQIDIKKWVADTKGFTMSHLGEIIKSVVILGNDFDDTIKELKKMKTIPQSRNYNMEEDEDRGIGFKSSKVTKEEEQFLKESMVEFARAIDEHLDGLEEQAGNEAGIDIRID